ncbi:MAG: hypothetical protein F6K50_12625 [Moorea sp. SIO3I7]|uniref:hypothetical protein n=1 Tax=Moorena sp. SIO3I8 TaxID=2607833 RepID=UPI0013C1D51B|nr:hypothetical protein [Moorena sp. SIO3I8]NEN96346.1 hypothetical protein [Moorena sp. SIO3I7]NEO06917.1 hypothetical protein [Moorena sp. SIO3I8]
MSKGIREENLKNPNYPADGGENPPLEETSDSLSWPHRAGGISAAVLLAPGRNQLKRSR